MNNAREVGLVKVVMTEFTENGVNMLQYADDTIFLLQDDYESAHNLKFILCLFEQMSGLKINFHKSELFLCGKAKDREANFADIFTCPVGTLPLKYLGMPIDEKRIRNKHWKNSEDKMEKKCSTGKGRMLPSGSKVTLIQSSLTGIPNFMMSFYGLPVGLNKRMDFFRARILWQEEDKNKKVSSC